MPRAVDEVVLRLASFALVWAFASQASAHEPPKGLSLIWASDVPHELPVIITNRGLVFADPEDGGARFSLRCSEAYGASTADKPSVFVTDGGVLTVGVYLGVSESSDRACTLQQGSGLPDAPIASLVSRPDAIDRMFVTVPSLNVDAGPGVYASTDRGRTWSERFSSHPDEFYSGLVQVPSAPERLYAYGLHADLANTKVTYFCSVSLDEGKTWEDHALATKIIPLAVHPSDPDVVFAYEATDKLETKFRVLRSSDRCATFTSVMEDVVQPTAFTGTADGATLWLGLGVGGYGGLFRSSDGGAHFERLLSDSVQSVSCLKYRQGRLWMCANLAPNTTGIWFSDDQGASFDKLLTFEQVRDPVACQGEAQAVCERPWADFAVERDLWITDAGTGMDAGGLDAGNAVHADGSAARDAGVTAHDARSVDADLAESESRDSSGCQAAAGRAAHRQAWGAWLAGLLALAVYRRRSARAARSI